MTTPAEPKYSDAEIRQHLLEASIDESKGWGTGVEYDMLRSLLAERGASRPSTPDKAATPVDAVTRSSALDAIGYVERHNGPGRANQARRMLMSATPDKAGVSDADVDSFVYSLVEDGWETPPRRTRESVHSALTHFASQSAEAVRDGERYRWLCKEGDVGCVINGVSWNSFAELDQAIDTAIQGERHE